MPWVIPVKFKYSARDLWFDPKNTNAQEGDHVICNTARGLEMGLCVSDAFEISDEALKNTLGDAELSDIIRVADEADYKVADEMAQKSDEAYPIFKRLAKESGLDIKPVAAEFIFGADKVVCYFAAEERVDFRQLVRDLSHELHTRIDMRQIGVREEAALVGGFAHCGQELCCTRFGARFEPVSIRMAKEQDLPLNSAKISGACGRLMCCLRYEFEAYRDFKQRAPKRNAVIDTPLGKARIVEYDTPKEQLCLRLENGKQMRIDLADMTCSKHGEGSDCCGKNAHGDGSDGCGQCCRPDTVSREVLDKLESPEIQMALDELDNKFAAMNDELDIAPEDMLIEKRKPRRQRTSSDRSSNKGSDQGAQKPRRVRKTTQKQEQSAQDTPEKKPTRKRRRVAGGQNQQQSQKQAEQKAQVQGKKVHEATAEPKAKPRRRKRVANDQQKQAPSQRTARRRPGDKGAVAPQPKAQNKKPEQNKGNRVVRRTRRPAQKNNQEQSQLYIYLLVLRE